MNALSLVLHALRSKWSTRRYVATLPLACFLSACGASPELEAPAEQVAKSSQFVVWLPQNDPLVTEHTAWHQNPCGTPGARKCTNRGRDFLAFHRGFLNRLRAKHESMGRLLDERLPVLVFGQDPAVFNIMPPSVRTAYDNVINNRNPADGNRPFADEDSFGTYLEANVHNLLHGLYQQAYPSDQEIGPVNMSPRSSMFFRIHGWVEHAYQNFQRGKLTDTRYSNLIFRNTSTGAHTVNTMDFNPSNGQVSVTASTAPLSWPPNSCNWYVGGVADFDFDGMNDILWHGPGCSRVLFWKMSRAALVEEIPNTLPGINNAWWIVGTGDFNFDQRPDIVWGNLSGQVAVWYMNGVQGTGGSQVFTLPSGLVARAVGSTSQADSALFPPAIFARSLTTGANRLYWFTMTGGLNGVTTLPTVSDLNFHPFAAGHYHPTRLAVADFGWWHQSNGALAIWAGSPSNDYAVTGSFVAGTPSSATVQLQGPR